MKKSIIMSLILKRNDSASLLEAFLLGSINNFLIKCIILLCTISVIPFGTNLNGQQVKMVADLNPTTFSSCADNLIEFEHKLYFSADDGTHGNELWVIDETDVPKMFMDILVGSAGSSPSNLFVCFNKLFFNAVDETGVQNLWVYDGKNLPVKASDYYNVNFPTFVEKVFIFKEKLYFQINDGRNYIQWVFDETSLGKVTEIYSGYRDYDLKTFATLNDKLYFITRNSLIWAYDGKGALYQVTYPFSPDDFSNASGFTVIDSCLIFVVENPYKTNGQFWKFDGINKPVQISNINYRHTYDDDIGEFIKFNNKIYFTVNSGDDSKYLWQLDGTNEPVPVFTSAFSPKRLTIFNNKLYFLAPESYGDYYLWTYDGMNPPVKVDEIAQESSGRFLSIWRRPFKNSLYLVSEIYELWRIDEKDTLTKLVDNIVPRLTNSNSLQLIHNNKLYIIGDPGEEYYTEFFQFDGINAPTKYENINTITVSSNPRSFAVKNNKLYFSAEIGPQSFTSKSFYVYDGINAPTKTSGCYGYTWSTKNIFKDKIYYLGSSGRVYSSYYFYDGINPSSHLVTYGVSISLFTEYQDKMYFGTGWYKTSGRGNELWEWDGETEAVHAPNVNDSVFRTRPDNFIVYDNKLYFTAKDTTEKEMLWVYDKTKAPEKKYEVNDPSNFLIFNNKLYFTQGSELWVYNGYNPPVLIKDFRPDSEYSDISNLKILYNKLYFSAYDGTKGNQLWSIEGDNPPTMVSEYCLGGPVYNPELLTEYNGNLYFTAMDSVHGRELWRCNGTDMFELIADINIGEAGSNVTEITVFDNHLFFFANDGTHDKQIWTYEGTNQPTMLANVVAGNFGSNPCNLIAFKNKLCFTASDPLHGNELYEYCPYCVTIEAAACDSFLFNGQYLKESGIYHEIIPQANGMDIIRTLDLKILRSFSTLNEIGCGSYISPSGKYIWTEKGTYMDTIPNVAGCDSIITINLSVGTRTESTFSTTVCGSYTSPSDKYTWVTSGVYSDTIPNSTGCDSIMTIDLTVLKNSSVSIYPIECSSYTSPSGKYIWETNGTYKDTIPNAMGCDSIITIYLTINNSINIIDTTVCRSYTSPSGKYTWTSNGTYTDTIPNTVGCDSIITIYLTLKKSTSYINVIACSNYKSPSGKYTWTTSGIYTDTIPNAAGCDSIITVNLSIKNTSGSIDIMACDNFTSPSGIYTWTSSGTYFDTIPNTIGCDSIITINLTLNNTFNTVDTTLCGSYTSPSGKYIWETSGTYLDTIPNASGCDSIITINLVIDCVNILENSFDHSFRVYPNPTNGLLSIDLGKVYPNAEVIITGSDGRIFQKQKNYNTHLIELKMMTPPGIYLITITAENERAVYRIMKN